MAELIEMPFVWIRVGPRKHVLGGVHIGATWRMRLNRPCSMVIRLFCRTRALQRVAKCRQSPYLHKLAVIIVTSLSLWRHSLSSRLWLSQPAT